MFQSLSSYFGLPIALWTSLALIPFLLVYLIRPKPLQKTIPSLMFLLRDKHKNKANALFRTLVREFLFLIQFLILVALILATAQPFLSVPEVLSTSDTVFVLDASASMQALDQNGARWQEAVSHVQSRLGSDNTLILAGAIPDIPLEKESADKMRTYLQTWRPYDEPTFLSSAILASREYVSDSTNVVIISDFMDTDPDQDFMDAVQTLRALGAHVELVQVGDTDRPSQNIGIIGVDVGQSETDVLVQNYYPSDKTVKICVGQSGSSCEELFMRAGASATFSFPTPPGTTRIYLDGSDDLAVDDEAFISTSDKTDVSVLVVTNGDFTKHPLYLAMQAIDSTSAINFNFQINNPPAIVRVEHDLVIFSDVDAQFLVKRTIRDTIENTRAGGGVIILQQEGIHGLGYDELLPFTYQSAGDATNVLNTGLSRALTGIDFGTTVSHNVVSAQRPMQVLAQSESGSPLISLYTLGAGSAVYYGLADTQSSFSSDPLYPVFWREMINTLAGRARPSELNLATGKSIAGEQIRGPDGTVYRQRARMSLQGIYETPSASIAATLTNPRESNTAVEPLKEHGSSKDFISTQRDGQEDITNWLIYAVLLLILIELLYVKWRGDA